MKTRHLFLWAVLAAMTITSCAKDGEFDVKKDGLSATLDCSAAATKVILADNPGIRMETCWAAGDRIGIFGTGASNQLFTVNASNISDNGRTALFKSTGPVPSGRMMAYSPYQPDAVLNGSTLSVTFPAVQQYTVVNGVPSPDASSSIMMGEGSAGAGLVFRNATAILKIGQVFDAAKVVKQVEFRALDGRAISGAAQLSWNDGAPVLQVTGTGQVITLDCGDGLEFAEGQLGIFYLVVPARDYPAGMQITFVCTDGNVVRTVGTTRGKTLDRSVVYLVGDLSANQPLPGTSSTLNPTAILMTTENMDKIKVLSSSRTYVYDENGRIVQTPEGFELRMPQFSMLVHKDLHPVKGGWMVFTEPTDDLPYGGTYDIKECNKASDGDWYEVFAKPSVNVAAPFANLQAGTLEEGIPLDIAGFITSIVDEQTGQEVPFQIGTKGEILLGESTVADMMGAETKAGKTTNHTFTSPTLGLTRKEPSKGLEFFVGGSISLDTKLAIRYMQGECQYVMLKVSPSMEVKMDAALKLEGNLDASCRLYTINVIGIQVAPGVIVVPKIVLTAKAGVGGSIQVSGGVKLTQKLGSYTIAYNKGDGVSLRGKMDDAFDTPDVNFEFGGLEGTLKVFGGLGVNTFLSFYGMAGLGLYNDFTLNFGTTYNATNGSLRMALTPEYEVTPAVTTLFGSKKFEDATAKVEFKPLWERYIWPDAKTTVSWQVSTSEELSVLVPGVVELLQKVPTGVTGIKYNIKLEGECVEDFKVAVVAYQGSGIQITPTHSDDLNGARLAAFRAAGVEHLYDMSSNKALLNPSEEPWAVMEVGTYPAGTKEKEFEGVAQASFMSGNYYGAVPAIIDSKGKIHVLNYGSSTRYYNPFVFWWPNRSNGQPYYLGLSD